VRTQQAARALVGKNDASGRSGGAWPNAWPARAFASSYWYDLQRCCEQDQLRLCVPLDLVTQPENRLASVLSLSLQSRL
jgi:hypothetical protein